ncbi:MAG: hypothetical protein WAV73_04400 [Candidatus Moraniibacteriota bacterium]
MNNINPLEYHYQTTLKLDYFILSAGIALLGWTVINTDWIPKGRLFILMISIFWILVILSIICGIIKQIYNEILFGLNYQYLQAGLSADEIERKTNIPGATFIDQQTREIINSDEFRKNANQHREKEEQGKKLYDKFMNRAAFLSNLAIIFLVIALCCLAFLKIYAIAIQS